MISNADIQTAFERTPELYDELMEKVLGLAAKTESRGGPSSAELLSAQLKLAQGTEEKKSVTSSVIQKGRRMSAMLSSQTKVDPLSPKSPGTPGLGSPGSLGVRGGERANISMPAPEEKMSEQNDQPEVKQFG